MPDVAKGRAFVAATGGALFGKAHALSEEVHLAMVSRGYTGTNRTMQHEPRSRAIDGLWVVVVRRRASSPRSGVDRVLGR